MSRMRTRATLLAPLLLAVAVQPMIAGGAPPSPQQAFIDRITREKGIWFAYSDVKDLIRNDEVIQFVRANGTMTLKSKRYEMKGLEYCAGTTLANAEDLVLGTGVELTLFGAAAEVTKTKARPAVAQSICSFVTNLWQETSGREHLAGYYIDAQGDTHLVRVYLSNSDRVILTRPTLKALTGEVLDIGGSAIGGSRPRTQRPPVPRLASLDRDYVNSPT